MTFLKSLKTFISRLMEKPTESRIITPLDGWTKHHVRPSDL